MSKITVLVFNRNLRVNYNQCINAALEQKKLVLPILFTDENYLSTFGSVSKIWFSKAITDLDESLRLSGGRLIISKLSLVSSLEKIAEHFDIEKIVFNDLHEPYFVNYKKILREFCVINSLNIEFVNSSYLTNPGDVTNEKGDYYKVFTPFSKKVFKYN